MPHEYGHKKWVAPMEWPQWGEDWRAPIFEDKPSSIAQGQIPSRLVPGAMMGMGDYGPYLGPMSAHGLDTTDATANEIEIPDPDNPGETKWVPTIPHYLRQESVDERREDMERWNTRLHGGAAPTPTAPTTKPSGGNVFANMFPDKDEAFWDSLKDQLAEAGADYDAADQPFKSLADTNVGTAFTRHKPVAAPSMLTTRGIPTGGSYNPYLGDPAKRKRVR